MKLAWESDKNDKEEWTCEGRKWSVETGFRLGLEDD